MTKLVGSADHEALEAIPWVEVRGRQGGGSDPLFGQYREEDFEAFEGQVLGGAIQGWSIALFEGVDEMLIGSDQDQAMLVFRLHPQGSEPGLELFLIQRSLEMLFERWPTGSHGIKGRNSTGFSTACGKLNPRGCQGRRVGTSRRLNCRVGA